MDCCDTRECCEKAAYEAAMSVQERERKRAAEVVRALAEWLYSRGLDVEAEEALEKADEIERGE